MVVLSRLISIGPSIASRIIKNSPIKLNLVFTRGIRQNKMIRKFGKMELAPEQLSEMPREHSMGRGLLKSYLFSVGFCCYVYATCVIVHYERFRSKQNSDRIINWAKSNWTLLEGWKEKRGNFRKHFNRWWNELSDGEKLFWPICGINSIVYACWQYPKLQKTMLRYFCSNPAARAVCWPLMLSTFSHYSLIHLGMNMFVLHSFSSTVCRDIGPEQMLALYLCGGVVSSLASSTFKVASRSIGPSIGASGAIMALLGYFCTRFPDSELGIFFIPNFTFSADSALKCMMGLDLAGIIFRWRKFDHSAHLGGALFGLLYAKYGPSLWQQTVPFVTKWHEFRIYLDKKLPD